MTETTGRAEPDRPSLPLDDPAAALPYCATCVRADVAHALNHLRRRSATPAARVLAALPFDIAVQVLDEPELEHRAELLTDLARSDVARLAALVEAMSADQQADLLREFPDAVRTRLFATLTATTQRALEALLRYPPDTAAGLMTTEFVAVPPQWTVEQTLQHVGHVAAGMETVYEIYVVDGSSARADRDAGLAVGPPNDDGAVNHGQLEHVVSLRELLTSNRDLRVADVGDRRAPLTVAPLTDHPSPPVRQSA